jgi:hypothetical protein
MDTSYRADKRLAAVPELANLVCMEFAAQDIVPPTPVVDKIVIALVDARQWLAGRGLNSDRSFQGNVGRETQTLQSQLSEGQSGAEPLSSSQVPELKLFHSLPSARNPIVNTWLANPE